MKYRIVLRQGFRFGRVDVSNGNVTTIRTGTFTGYVAERTGLLGWWYDISGTVHEDISEAQETIRRHRNPSSVVWEAV